MDGSQLNSTQCPSCDAKNPEGARFCDECASPLPVLCPKCRASNRAGANFCNACATPLTAGAPTHGPANTAQLRGGAQRIDEPASAAMRLAVGERRHLTIMFCDLVGSTEISSQLDPEEWRELVGSYHRAAAAAIERFGGRVAQYLGDGVLAYFGWPQAHEDDAERAVHAGLAIVEATAALNEHDAPAPGAVPAPQIRLAVRVGIHTGMAVVGQGAEGDIDDVFGDTPNIASRVQAIAEPESVLIIAAVHQLVSGRFIVEARAPQRLKGVVELVDLYRVKQASGTRSRLGIVAAQGLTPFVGRDDEMRLLSRRWELAREGSGQLVLITGEAGIGKSRLVQEFRDRLAGTPHTWIECDSAPYFQNTPFYPISDMLQQSFSWRGNDTQDEKLGQLEQVLALANLKLSEAVPLLAPLVGISVKGKYPELSLSPEQERKRLMANIAAWVFGAARAQSLVIVVEDLHWVDPSTLELLQMLAVQGATVPLLLLCAARPEFRAPWPMREHHSQITLNRMSRHDMREIIARVAIRAALRNDLVETLVERTGGVPLFAEELTRGAIDNSDRDGGREIPPTLQDSLTGRLDRLGPAKEVTQMAAVIGREFSYQLLSAISSMPADVLESSLEKLIDADLIYARGIPPEATYQFKHALIQEAAYSTLLKSRRKELHRSIATALAERFPDFVSEHPEISARHWTEVGDSERAITAWMKAGELAHERHAFREAEESYKCALAILSTLPEGTNRDARELQIGTALIRTFWVTKGWATPDTLEAIARVRLLAKKSGNLLALLGNAYSTFAAVLNEGDLLATAAVADEILELAKLDRGIVSAGFGHMAQCMTRYYRGDFAGSEDHFLLGSPYFLAQEFQQIPGTTSSALGHGCLTAWKLGRSDSARERASSAIAAARENRNPYDLAFAQLLVAVLHLFLREPERSEVLADQALSLSIEHGFPQFAAMSRIVRGNAQASLGRAREGVTLIRQGLAENSQINLRLAVTFFLNCLAEAQAANGSTAEALRTIEESLQANSTELADRPETLRLRGEFQLRDGNLERASTDLREAIAIAKDIGAKAWELRAATSLARLLAKQGKRDEAHATLSEIYGWFTEGFDTADLKDAKALLDELAA